MGLQGILQHVVQAVFQIDDIRVGVELMDAALNEQAPLFFRIADLRHLALSRDHLVARRTLGLHFRHFPVHAAFVAVMLLGRIKHLLRFRKVIGKHAGQEPETAVFGRLIPQRQRGIHLVHPGLQPRLIFLADHAVFAGEGAENVGLQLEPFLQFVSDHAFRDRGVLVIQILMHKVCHRAQVLHVIPGDGQVGDHGAQAVHAHRQIAQRGRRFAGALAVFHPGAFVSLFRDGPAGHGPGAAVEKMVDFLLRFVFAVTGITGGQAVDQVDATLKRRQVGDHGVPVMLGERGGMLLAVPDEIALMQYDIQPGLGALFPLHGRIIDRRHGFADLRLGVPALRMEENALHHDRILLAVVKARKPHDAGFIDAHGIAVKMLHQLLLDIAEQGDVPVPYKPVGVQGLPGLNDHAGRQRESVDPLLLLLKGRMIHFNKLRVDAGDRFIVMTAKVHGEEDAAVQRVMVAEGLFHGGELPAFDGIFRAWEDPLVAVFKHTQADLFVRVEQAVQDFLCGYVHPSITSRL